MKGKLFWHFLSCGVSPRFSVVSAGWENSAEELWIMQTVPVLQVPKQVLTFWKLESHSLWFVDDSELSVPLSVGAFMSVCSYEGPLASSNMGAQAAIFSLLGKFRGSFTGFSSPSHTCLFLQNLWKLSNWIKTPTCLPGWLKSGSSSKIWGRQEKGTGRWSLA